MTLDTVGPVCVCGRNHLGKQFMSQVGAPPPSHPQDWRLYLNPEPRTCQASSLLLSHIPICVLGRLCSSIVELSTNPGATVPPNRKGHLVSLVDSVVHVPTQSSFLFGSSWKTGDSRREVCSTRSPSLSSSIFFIRPTYEMRWK